MTKTAYSSGTTLFSVLAQHLEGCLEWVLIKTDWGYVKGLLCSTSGTAAILSNATDTPWPAVKQGGLKLSSFYVISDMATISLNRLWEETVGLLGFLYTHLLEGHLKGLLLGRWKDYTHTAYETSMA